MYTRKEKAMLVRIDFHDQGPPGSKKDVEFVSLLDKVGVRKYLMIIEPNLQMDLETELSKEELQRFIVDNFTCVGTISFDDEIVICQEGHHHDNKTKTGSIVAE